MAFTTIIEPFRIKSVEPIYMSTEAERKQYLQAAHYNTFLLHANQVIIDFLTDSGTSAMSSHQWAAIMQGDESYAGASSWLRLQETIIQLTGMPHILPTHQGRAAEKILYNVIGGEGKTFISNTHFDTTRANIEYSGAEAIDIRCPQALDPNSDYAFKGDLDTEKLLALIREKGASNIAAVILTVTNNSGGGQPVSMCNARAVRDICSDHKILFVLDCCRIAENSYFIKHFEADYNHYTYEEIARMMFALSDAAVMSSKKDALVNMGGFLSLRNDTLAEACTQLLIITEGFATYGGLAGRDMEAMAVGLKEVFDPAYLQYRIKSTQYLGEKLKELGIPIIYPVGGHAVYIDAHKLYNHIPVHQYPGQALVCDLYSLGGIRAVEIGSLMFGKYDTNGNLVPAAQELVRLAIPRRVYTQSHIDYVIEVFAEIIAQKHMAKGFRIIKEPKFLRHFTAHLQPI